MTENRNEMELQMDAQVDQMKRAVGSIFAGVLTAIEGAGQNIQSVAQMAREDLEADQAVVTRRRAARRRREAVLDAAELAEFEMDTVLETVERLATKRELLGAKLDAATPRQRRLLESRIAQLNAEEDALLLVDDDKPKGKPAANRLRDDRGRFAPVASANGSN